MISKNLIHIAWFLCTAIVLPGCGLTGAQKHDIDLFGQAAATLGAASEGEFVSAREHVIEMKGLRLAIEKKTLSQVPPDGSPATRDFYSSRILDLDSGLDQDNISSRVAAVDLLQQYGNLLTAFSSAEEKELQDASDNFARSLTSFPHNPMSKEEVAGVGDLVRVAGSTFLERKKKDTLEEVIPKVSPLIVAICDSLENNFDPHAKGVAGTIYQVQDRLASEAIDGLKRPGDSISDRLILLNGLAFADREKEELEISSRKLLKTVAALRKANEQLVDVVTHHKIGVQEIKEFGEEAADLAKAVKPFLGRL
jgi:hypothetical protein